MWARVSIHFCARPLRIWIELSDVGLQAEGHLSIYDHNPEESKNSNISLGFSGCYKDIFVKMGDRIHLIE